MKRVAEQVAVQGGELEAAEGGAVAVVGERDPGTGGGTGLFGLQPTLFLGLEDLRVEDLQDPLAQDRNAFAS